MTAPADWDDQRIQGRRVSPGEQPQCPFCGRFVVRLSVIVYGQPRKEVTTMIDSRGVGACGDCAAAVIGQACDEADWSKPAVVVIPVKAVA